jgi:hypothetical protein
VFGLLVQPLASDNHPVGPALDVPPVFSILLAINFAHVTSVNRDASGNVVVAVNLAGFTFDLDYSSVGQITGATVLGFPIPVSLI